MFMQLGTFMILFFISAESFGSEGGSILRVLKKRISDNYNAAQVNLTGPIEWIKQSPGKMGNSVQILGDNAHGDLRFSVTGLRGEYAEGHVTFSAWMPAQIAVKRIHPGEVLKNEWFTSQKINVSTGPARDYRGLLLGPGSDISKFESVQTIMEGQFLASSAIRNVPDIRRGDSVRIHLVNESLMVSTPGVAQETGYLNRQIRVLTSRSKRELLGQLQAENIVEVKL
jgi:flagella basal body P-ring formation protein FlgA